MPSQSCGGRGLLDIGASVGNVALMSVAAGCIYVIENAAHNLKVVGSNPTPATT